MWDLTGPGIESASPALTDGCFTTGPSGKAPTPVFLPGESPWTEEPGGLQTMGSQKVEHD